MIVDFNYQQIPQELKLMCRSNLSSESLTHAGLIELVEDINPAAAALLKAQKTHDKDPGAINTNQGYYAKRKVRNHLASMFAHHKLKKFHTKQIDPSFISQLILFEDAFYDQEREGHSRVFMLGLYLLFLEIELDLSNKLIESAKKIAPLFEGHVGRPLESDLLILSLWHFNEYFGGTNELEAVLVKNDYKFSSVLQTLEKEFRDTLTRNMVMYMSSTN